MVRLLVIFLLFSLNTFGQDGITWRFDHFTQKDGLSNNQVHCIFQDQEGWMWFGTTYGLNRFDGRHFKAFKYDAADTTSLSANLVRVIFQDSRGILWIGLENGGLCRYDHDREYFLRNQLGRNKVNSVNDMTEDRNGDLWLATSNGLVHMKYQGEGHFEVKPVPLALLSSHVKKIQVDRQGLVWIGTDVGLYAYDSVKKKLTHLPLPATDYPDDEIWAIYIDQTSKVWIGTYNSGLYYVNPWELKVVKSSFIPGMERARTIRAISGGQNGRLWLGTRAGLFAFDGERYEYHGLGEELGDMTSVNSVLSLCVDMKGDLWIGSRQGISYFVDEKQFIRLYTAGGEPGYCLNNGEVYAFWCEGNRVWIGTELGGVNCLDRKTGKFTYYTRETVGLSSNCVKAFMQDGNELWVGTFMGGINVMDIHTGRVLRKYLHTTGKEGGLLDNRVWAIFKDRQGTIWIGTSRGIEQYDRKRNRFIHRPDIVRAEQVNWMMQDKDGDLWIGCEDELIIYNMKRDQVRRYYRKTRAMVEYPYREYYVSTINGLARFDKSRGFYHFYTEKEGLVNNYSHSLLVGGDSTIWISTTNGLSLFDIPSRKFKNFQAKDGLQDNQFNYGAFAKNAEGELFFGGINGFNVINPDLVRTNEYVPPVVITDIKLFNESLKVKPGGILTRNVAYTDKICLKYDQNMLSFSFASLNYVMAEKNQYRYRLEGLEDQWVEAGNTNIATYTNLSPGEYTFRVIGSNNDGVWNEEGASLGIVIVPPFWKSWWFMVLMGVVLLLIIFALARAYIYRETLKNRLLLEKKQARKLHDVDMMKLQFFTNVSHEIRTPLTLIIGPVEKLWRQAGDEDSRVQLGMVYQNARKLLKLINQLLDFRKLEAGKYRVDYQNGDLVRFISGIAETFRYPALEKGIELQFSANQPKFITRMDADKLEKIIDNLLSNALKFTPQGGQVTLSLHIGEDAYSIRVEDTGKGIPVQKLQEIFNRFFQASPEDSGTGIGLAITRNFVELMGGTIDVKSEEGKGSVFTIHLPLIAEEKVEGTDIAEVTGEMIAADRKYLLVVDDNEDIRTFIRTHFKANYQILEAGDGKAGYETAVKHIPDVIIADMLMPVMNGLEMCRKLKKDERTSHIPVIMLTAVNSKETELESLLTGIDDYITKPFDINILNAKVDNLLNIRNALREKVKSELLLQPKEVEIDSPNDRFLKKAVEVVEKYMDDPDLDIEKFAEEMGVSRMQLYRKFEALANMTVKEFIRSIRLKRAAQMLVQEKLTVSEIAWAVGFKDLSYFRKCFKEEFGMTPTEYVNQRK